VSATVVSWWVIGVLAAGAYGFKVGGLVLLGGVRLPAWLVRCVAAWRRAPFPVVILLAAVVTAALRAWT
jgi:hypothetical protein